MVKTIIDEAICKGCGLCVQVCPKEILYLDTQRMNGKGYNPARVTDQDLCISCAMCAIMCPDSAITVEKEDK